MLKDQEQFYQFILAQTKPAHQEEVKALLVDAFANLDTDNFTKADLQAFEEKMTPLLDPASVELVKEVFQKFGGNLK